MVKEQVAKEAAVKLLLEGNTANTEEQLKHLLDDVFKIKRLTLVVSLFYFVLCFVDTVHTFLTVPKLFLFFF